MSCANPNFATGSLTLAAGNAFSFELPDATPQANVVVVNASWITVTQCVRGLHGNFLSFSGTVPAYGVNPSVFINSVIPGNPNSTIMFIQVVGQPGPPPVTTAPPVGTAGAPYYYQFGTTFGPGFFHSDDFIYYTIVPIPYGVTGAVWAAGVATLTIGTHPLVVGNVVTVSGVLPFGYNGSFVITAKTSTTISFAIPFDPTPFVSSGSLVQAQTLPVALLTDAAASNNGLTAAGTIYGTAGINAAGTYSFIIRTHSFTTNQFVDVVQTITINPTIPSILNDSSVAPYPNGEDAVPFSYQILATQSPTSYNATGLPTGLTVNASTGLITGTPATFGTAPDDEFYPVVLSATNGTGTGSKTIAFSIIAHVAPKIHSALVARPEITLPFSYSILAWHHPTSFSTGALPAGLSLSGNIISGTPNVLGTFSVSITATNAYGSDTKTLVLNIGFPPPTITSPASIFGQVGTNLNYQITIDPFGQPATSYAASGLPTWFSINTSTGLVSGVPTATGNFVFTISASNAGLYGAVPADAPSTKTVTATIFAAPPVVQAISPNIVGTNTTGTTFAITGIGFIGGGTAAVILGNSDQGLITITAGVTFVNSTTVTFTIASIPASPIPYDVSVRNSDNQIGTLIGGLIVVPPGVSAAGAARLTSLDSLETPIYSSTKSSQQTLVPRSRAFALGTNVEVMFYSGRDVPGNKLLNVHRKQSGSTSTRHGAGDLVFPGTLSVQASPTSYVTNNGKLQAIYCLIRSNGAVTVQTMQESGVVLVDNTSSAKASYQAILVREPSVAPVFDLEELS